MRVESQPISSRIALYGGIFGFLRGWTIVCVVRCRWKLPFYWMGVIYYVYYVWFWDVTFYLFWSLFRVSSFGHYSWLM